MTSPVRLLMLFLLTIFGGVAATMITPAFTARYATAHAQTAHTHSAASAPPVAWRRAIATRALVRGDTLRAGDFQFADSALHGRLPYGADTTPPEAGWLVHRAISSGEWLRPPAVAPRPAVIAGQPVHVSWSDGAVSIAVSAVALNSAPVGGAVTVRVGRTRRLDGIAIAPDSVRLR